VSVLVVEVRSDERWLSHGGGCRIVAADMEISNRLDWYMGTFRRKMWVRCGYVRCVSATPNSRTFSTHARLADALSCSF